MTGSVNIEEDEELTGWYWSWSVSGIVTRTFTMSAGPTLSFRIDVARSTGTTNNPTLNYATASEPIQNSGIINSFETINVTSTDKGTGSGSVQADSSTDILTLEAGDYISVVGTPASDTVSVSFNIPQTAAELAAGVTPTNYEYEPGNVLRYGTNTTPGTTDMTTPIQDALDSNMEVLLPKGDYLITSAITLNTDNVLRGEGCN